MDGVGRFARVKAAARLAPRRVVLSAEPTVVGDQAEVTLKTTRMEVASRRRALIWRGATSVTPVTITPASATPLATSVAVMAFSKAALAAGVKVAAVRLLETVAAKAVVAVPGGQGGQGGMGGGVGGKGGLGGSGLGLGGR